MQARMANATGLLPDAHEDIGKLVGTIYGAGLPGPVLHLTHLRVSQINGCAWCTDGGAKQALKQGETTERLFAVAAWREAPYFSEAERAALALAEAATRVADREDPVPDPVWEAAAAQFDERSLAALVLWIGLVNLFNRVNVCVRLVAGTRKPW